MGAQSRTHPPEVRGGRGAAAYAGWLRTGAVPNKLTQMEEIKVDPRKLELAAALWNDEPRRSPVDHDLVHDEP